MGQVGGTKTDRVDAQPNGGSMRDRSALGSGGEAFCPDCGHPIARHEGSLEDEFVASHGGVGYAICLEVDPSGEATDRCGCRMVIGGSSEAGGPNSPIE
jgi:hypothetical protein